MNLLLSFFNIETYFIFDKCTHTCVILLEAYNINYILEGLNILDTSNI